MLIITGPVWLLIWLNTCSWASFNSPLLLLHSGPSASASLAIFSAPSSRLQPVHILFRSLWYFFLLLYSLYIVFAVQTIAPTSTSTPPTPVLALDHALSAPSPTAAIVNLAFSCPFNQSWDNPYSP
ncbi:hypothetical protein BDW74DRAFT_114673 [Aspergillus multicolor]|uniref:uncharacterized protein n=1 Tax=Aspergillus multicolor TaxID=41759 RepID=UPI003CCD6876